MAAAPFLALLAIAMLMLAALRLEFNFRRTVKARSGRELRRPRPQLRMAPAGGYCQASLSAAVMRKG